MLGDFECDSLGQTEDPRSDSRFSEFDLDLKKSDTVKSQPREGPSERKSAAAAEGLHEYSQI